MTEKRFSVEKGMEHVLCWEIQDKENEDRSCGEYAELLNNLYEENEELKKELSTKAIHLDFLRAENRHMRDLVAENQQLKQEIKELEEFQYFVFKNMK